MNYNIVYIILILAKGVKMEMDYDNMCSEVTGPNREEIDVNMKCSSGSKPCLVKCCGPNEIYFKTKFLKKCMTINELMTKYPQSRSLSDELASYSGLKIKKTDGGVSTKAFKDFHILYRKNFTSDSENCTASQSQTYVNVMENGFLPFEAGELAKAPKFCVEMFIGLTLKNKTLPYYKYFFVLDPPNPSMERKYKLIAYGNLVSAFFLFLLLVVYGLLKQLHKNLHGMLLIAFIASLSFFILFLNSKTLYSFKLLREGRDADELSVFCEWLSPIAYFFLLSAFFWMNTMSFDIWWTFRGVRKVREIHRRGIYVKFFTYAMYAWGVPAAITVIAIIIDKSDVPDYVMKPKFHKCQPDYGLNAARMYKYLPMLVLVVSNVVFYLLTIYNIWMVQKTVKGFDKDSKRDKKNKNQFIIYIKLSVIMGINWLLEVAQTFMTNISEGLFVALNIFNALIGVVIFVILICRPSVFIMLCRRFNIENRWTRRSSNIQSSRADRSKDSMTHKTKYTDSIQIESCVLSTADTPKTEQNQLCPRFTETEM